MDKMTTGDVPCPNCGRWGCSGINCPGPLGPWTKPDQPTITYTQPMVYNMTLLPLLTKRELIAAMAMQGVLSSAHPQAPTTSEEVASYALGFADALLAALEGKGE